MIQTNICELLNIFSDSTEAEITDAYIKDLQDELLGKGLSSRKNFEHTKNG